MIIQFHRDFKKEYKKQGKKIKTAFDNRLVRFIADEFDPALNNHPLRGKFEGYRSINISGDIRALYKRRDPETVVLTIIVSHSKLYK